MRVLITGGAGFIGSHLSEAILKRGHEVTIIDDLSTGRLENLSEVMSYPNFKPVIETIMNENVMDRLVSECDVIFHLASAVGVELIVTSPVEVIERCVAGTETVLRIANRYKKKVLITSTSEIYGKNTEVPFNEEDDRLLGPTTKSRWSYSCSKAIDEFLSLAYFKEKKLPIVIVRLFNTIGPRQSGQYGMVVPRFVEQAMHNEDITVYGSGEQSRCFTYVSDVVGCMISLMNHEEAVGQIFNIGNDNEITIMGLAERIKSITGSSSNIVKIPYDEAYETGFEDMERRVPDLSKVKKLVGYDPAVQLDEMIMRVWEYFKLKEKSSSGLSGGAHKILDDGNKKL
jgi:UDP-glucose 4-epimerase